MLATLTKSLPSKIPLTLPRLHRAQRSIKGNLARFNVIRAGRRFGKDILCRDLALEIALGRGPLAGGPVGWYEPTYKSLTDNWRAIRGLLAGMARFNQTEMRLELITGGVIEMWSLTNPDASRGRKYRRVIINEAGMMPELAYAWQNTIRPTLMDYRGDAIFSGTPKGLNYFHELWQMTQDADATDWRGWHYPTSANPHIPQDEIEAARLELPERVFQQEILAEFVEDGAYFQRVNERAVIAEPDLPEQHAGHYLVAGLDWAKSADYTVLTVLCRDCCRVVDWDRFNKIDFTYQRERVINRLTPWGAALLPERNSIGDPNIELLRDRLRVLNGPDGSGGFQTTATTKAALIQRLASGLEHDGLLVPTDYSGELRSFQVDILPSGSSRFAAPAGQHDDRVISLALAWWAAVTISPAVQQQPEQRGKFELDDVTTGSRWRA